jgi:Ca2+-binding EF-hand superfamily protein
MEEARALPDLKDISTAVLERYFRRLFALADTDNNGVLDPREFHNLLEKSGLGFSPRLIRKVMVEADINEDKMIQWEEFVPVMIEIVDAHRVRNYKASDEEKAINQATEYVYNDLTQEQLERFILKLFLESDTDNNGVLDKGEFLACIRQLDFGLTTKEINFVMSQVDTNQDGMVSYEEFVPFATDLLVQIVADKILESETHEEVRKFFCDTFSKFDAHGTGRLTIDQTRDALASVGISTIQVQSMIEEATRGRDAGAMIHIKSFSRVVAQMYSDFFEWREDRVTVKGKAELDAVDAPAADEEAAFMSPEELERYLRQLFYQADVESNGFLRPRDFGQLLRGSGLGFSNKTIRKIIEEADVDSDGRIDYLEFVSSIAGIIEAEQTKAKYAQTHWEDEARARAAAAEFLLKGVSRDWLERSMLKIFVQCDTNNNGTLELNEFIQCLRVFDLGITRKEITFLMSEIDTNNDGVISYEEFVPTCFDLLVDMIKEKFMDDHGQLRMMEYFMSVFEGYDHQGTGKLSVSQVREALSTCSVKLSAVQTQAIVSEAVQDEGGLVNHKAFARVAALMVSDMYGLALDSKQSTAIVEAPALDNVATPLNPEVEAMVRRYEGDREAVKARSLAATPGLRGKLTDLSSQLARVQDENDVIRQRYLELEDAWQAMGDENNSLKRKNGALESELQDKSSALAESQALNKQLQQKLEETHQSFLQQRDLAAESKQMLIAEQLEMSKKTQEAGLLRRESVSQEQELRKLRDAWNTREARMKRLEEQRSFYEQELAGLGASYQGLVDKLSFVVSDYSVRTTPIQVRVGGGYELLSNYLNRVFDEQDAIAKRFAQIERFPESPVSSPHKFPSPARNNNGSPARSTALGGDGSRVFYEPLQGQLACWPESLRSPTTSPKNV